MEMTKTFREKKYKPFCADDLQRQYSVKQASAECQH